MSNGDEQASKGQQPLQFYSYESLSPLYLNELVANSKRESYVNNARILQTFLFPIDPEGNYQVLHIIDTPLDYAYVNRRQQIRAPQVGGGASGASLSSAISAASSMGSSGATKFRTVKRALSLDDLLGQQTAGAREAILEFGDRFGDLRTKLAQADVLHARALKHSDPSQRVALVSREALNFEPLARELARQWSANGAANPELRRRLVNASESNTLNTYFLPVNSEELDQLLQADEWRRSKLLDALEAHVIPNQVLFTRQLELARDHPTLASAKAQQAVSVSLAKVMLASAAASDAPAGPQEQRARENDESRQLLAAPLLLEAEATPTPEMGVAAGSPEQTSVSGFAPGISSSEILLANIPIANGVLHLIRRPLLLADTNLLDYINDNDNQLTNLVQSLGSRTGSSREPIQPVQLNRFRELLARDRQLLASFSEQSSSGSAGASNRTILAPSDEAFARLRYDLRALVLGDETLIPAHWDPSYRADLLERLLKRHIVPEQALTSGQLAALVRQQEQQPQPQQQQQQGGSVALLGARGQPIQFRLAGGPSGGELEVECDGGPVARLLHRDLGASNGVLHIVDRVLGEEQETVHTLIRALVVRQTQQQQEARSPAAELERLLAAHTQTAAPTQLESGSSSTGPPLDSGEPTTNGQLASATGGLSAELQLVARTVEQYLEEAGEQGRAQLAASVNLSQQLAQLASRAEGRQDEWGERFKMAHKQFTYFMPTDLAWLRLQQTRPELHKPIMHLLQQQPQAQAAAQHLSNEQTGANRPSLGQPRASESSHRLLQVSSNLTCKAQVSRRKVETFPKVFQPKSGRHCSLVWGLARAASCRAAHFLQALPLSSPPHKLQAPFSSSAPKGSHNRPATWRRQRTH